MQAKAAQKLSFSGDIHKYRLLQGFTGEQLAVRGFIYDYLTFRPQAGVAAIRRLSSMLFCDSIGYAN